MKSYRETDREIFLKACKYLKEKLNFKPKNLLDLGCGNGDFTLEINKIFNLEKDNLYGIEYDENCVCVSKGIKCIKYNLNEKLPYEDNFFDLITANQVLEHIFNIDELLLEIKRILKPGGYLIVGTPNLAALHERISLLLGYNPSTLGILQKFK